MKAYEEHDVIVVGSGAGGAPLAAKLAAAGLRVLIIEAGPWVNPAHLGSCWTTAISNRYYHNFAALSMSDQFATIYYSENVGGTTVFAGGSMVRSLQDVFLSHGIDLESAFQEIERDLGVQPLPIQRMDKGTRKIMETAQSMGLSMVPMPKGLDLGRNCKRCGECVFGCPTGTKTDARLYVNQAIDNNAKLMTSTKVVEVLHTSGEVYGVKTRNGKEFRSKIVVLAAGGLNTPVILQQSGINAGNHLFVDFFNATYGIVDDLSQLMGPTMGAVCLDFHEEQGFLLSPFVDPWSQAVISCPQLWWILKHLGSWRENEVGIMAKIKDKMVGRVHRNGSISKTPTDDDWGKLEAGAKMSAKILKEMGVRDIIHTKHPRGAHPGGTAAVGEVVDSSLQVKGVEGLYVSDCSSFPEVPGLPPMMTIMALGLWLGDELAGKI